MNTNKKNSKLSTRPKMRRGRSNLNGLLAIAPSALATHMALPRITNDTHRFVRGVTPVTLAKSASNYASVATFQLSDVQGYTDFTSLYDQYMITSVQFTLRLEAVPGITPIIIFATSDYDGGSTPDIDLIQQRRHLEVYLTPDRPTFTFTLKPRVATSVGVAGGSSSLSGIDSTWIDAAAPTVVHYGVSYVLKNYNSGNSSAFVTQSAQYNLKMRSCR